MMMYLGRHTECTVVIQTPHILALVSVVAEGRFAARWSMSGIPPETVAIVYNDTQILEWCANVLMFGSHTDRSTRKDAEQAHRLYTPLVSEVFMMGSDFVSPMPAGIA